MYRLSCRISPGKLMFSHFGEIMEIKDLEILESYLNSALNKVTTFESSKQSNKIAKNIATSLELIQTIPVSYRLLKNKD